MTAAAIIAAITAFNELEPEIQKGIVDLIHLFHKKTVAAPAAPVPTEAPNA